MTVRYHTRRGVEVPDYQCMNRCIQDGAAPLPNHPRRTHRRRRRPPAARHPHPARPRGRPDRPGRTRHPRRRSRRAAPRARRTRPPPRRPGPPPLPGRRPGQPARRRQPRSRLERRATRPADRTRGLRPRQRRRHSHPHRRAEGPNPSPWQQISPHSGPTHIPSSATANAWSACWSTTSPCTRPTASTCTSASAADKPTASSSRSHPHPGKPAKPAPTPSPNSTGSSDTHTDAETADALNVAGHRSGENKPFTAGIVVHVRRKYHLPSHADRLRAQGLLTTTELAQRLTVHPSTIKSWTEPESSTPTRQTTRTNGSTNHPSPGDPRLTTRQGSPLRKRVHTPPAPGGAL